MEELLEEAISRLREIDPVDQRYWAWCILEGLEEDRKWDEMLNSPESLVMLDKMAEEAIAEHRAGLTLPLEDLLAEDDD